MLVDYDLTTVPLSRSLASRVQGNKHHRPPKLPPNVPVPNDNFAAWLIYYSLKIIAHYPAIWNIAGAKPGRLLFSEDDLRKPHTSHLFRILKSHYSETVRDLAEDVETLLKTAPQDIEPLRVKVQPLQALERLMKVESTGTVATVPQATTQISTFLAFCILMGGAITVICLAAGYITAGVIFVMFTTVAILLEFQSSNRSNNP